MTEDAHGRIVIDLFTTLDGVAQAPGGPDEDAEGGFAFGGWQAPLIDDVDGATVSAGMERMDALLLGRKTYDIFAGYWPQQTGAIADLFNRLPKYVVSRSALEPEWAGTTRIGVDVAAEIADLRVRHREVHVIGSVDFVQTLFAGGIFDVLNLWVYPLVLGAGKRVFDGGPVPTSLRLIDQPVVSGKGTVLLRYARVDGVPAVGDMTVAGQAD